MKRTGVEMDDRCSSPLEDQAPIVSRSKVRRGLIPLSSESTRLLDP